MAFIFDPSKGETPESLRKKREIAEALRANAMGMASSPGEGLAMIGAALGSRMADGRAKKIAASGQQQAASAMAPILAAFGGGSPAPSTPTPSVSNNVPIGKADPVQSVMDAAPKPQAGGDWLKYANSGATRNLPLSDNLKGALGFLPELGVSMEVFSGGQPGKGSGKPRVGSTRHDHGNAADVFFYKDGKRLNWADPQDRPVFEEIVRRGKANGVTGFGAGDGYMQPGSMHLGFGGDAVWGAGGKGANAPDWLRAAYNGAPTGRSSPAAQAVNAMAQGGQSMPQAAPQVAPQPMQGGGGAMDVWQGRAQQGVASDGSQLVRTPEGVQRTSTKGYSEIIRPEGPPSERAPMPMRGQGGGIGAIISSLLGRGQSQGAQPMPQQMAPQQGMPQAQQPVTDPAAYNAGVVRMSPDLGGPARQPVPQNQPPIPGIQPTPMNMQDMAGRMPAPQGQPMPQGMDALRTALQPQQVAPQPAPVQQAPVAAPQAQPAPQTAQVPAGGIALPQLLQIAQNPWVAENKLYGGIINTLIENQLNMNKPMNPMEKAQLEKLLIETEQLRNPVAKPTGDMTEYDLYVEQATAAGQAPMPFLEYQQALKKAGATNVTTNLGEGDKFYENLDKKNAETFSALSETGMQARGKLAQVDRLGALLTAAPQGASAMLKQAAGEYGINTEGLSDIQAAQALINELVPQQRQPGSGPMSDADLALFKQSLPRLINQPEGNRAIIETMRGITQYQIQMGDIADAVSNREMTPAEGRKAIASLENPLAGFGKKMGQFQSAPANSAQGVPSGVDPAVWEVMTPEERALFQ